MAATVYEFGPYQLIAAERLLLRQGASVPLTPKAVEVLLVVVERAGQVVRKEEILRRVWPETSVVEGNLTQTIFMLRKALGESSDGVAYIETLPKLGYRFLAEVRKSEATGGNSPGAARTTFSAASEGTRSGVSGHSTTLFATSLAILLAVLGFTLWRRAESHAKRNASPHPIQTIAVLPMANLSGDSSQEYFADGMTDELITTLSEVRTLQVTSRTSVMRYRKTSEPLPQIARELGVDVIVEGAVVRSGGSVRITAGLIDGASGRHLWAATYVRPLSDALVVQAEIAREIARRIQVQLDPSEEARLRARRPLNPEAQEEYLLARFYWDKRNPADLREALQHFQKAVAVDPDYAEAFAGLADCYLVMPIYERASVRNDIARAKAAAQEALRLDGSLAEAHTSLAYTLEYEWDFSGAEREYRRAIALKPSYATAHQWYGEFLRLMDRQEEAIAQSKIAMRLDPLSPVISMEAALPFYYRSQYPEAIQQLHQAIALDPKFGPAYGNLGWVLEQQGEYTEALQAFEQARKLGLNDSPWILGGMGWAYARSGDRRKAAQCLARLESLVGRSDEPATQIALLMVALGNKQEALRWYERAFRQHDWWLLPIGVDPKLVPLRDNPEFRQLVQNIGLPGWPGLKERAEGAGAPRRKPRSAKARANRKSGERVTPPTHGAVFPETRMTPHRACKEV